MIGMGAAGVGVLHGSIVYATNPDFGLLAFCPFSLSQN
jgi:hypothetical protein